MVIIKRNYLKPIINVLRYLMIYFMIALVVGGVLKVNLNCPLYISLTTVWILTILVCTLWLKSKKENLFILCNFTMIHWRDIVYPFLVIGGIDFLIIYTNFGFSLLPDAPQTSEVIGLIHSNPILAFLVLSLIGPMFEEIFYRGLIFNEFRSNFPSIIAIVLQAIIFSVLHERSQMIYAFIAGILFAVLYLWLKTIWAPIIAHIINYNLFLYSSTLIKLNSCCYGLFFVLPMLAMLVFSIYQLWKNRNKIFCKHQIN